MNLARFFASLLLFAFIASGTAAAQMPPPGPAGMELEIAGEIDVNQMPITWTAKYDAGGRFYYARYVNGALEGGSIERAQSARYGVYYSLNDASRWVIQPKWSGLFPVNSDYAIVREPGKDEWLGLDIAKGKTNKIGKGELRIMDVLHPQSISRLWYAPVYRYYLSTGDNGETQTVSFVRWNEKKKRIENWGSYKNVFSPSNVAGITPLQLTQDLDVILQVSNGKGGVSEQVIEHYDIHSAGRLGVLKQDASSTGPFVFTGPSRVLLKVLDEDRQLYLPYDSRGFAYSALVMSDLYAEHAAAMKGFVGIRAVGNRVTLEPGENPLLQLDESGFGALWETADGVRLAPLLPQPTGYCHLSYYPKEHCAVPQERPDYLGYPDGNVLKESREKAKYVALEYIEVPEDVRWVPNSDTRISAALLAELPDGQFDIWAAMPWINKTRESPKKMNETPFATREEAANFFEAVSTTEGLRQFRIAENNARIAASAAEWAAREAARRAALTQAERDAEDYAIALRQAKAERSAKLKKDVQALLAARDISGAMALAKTDWAEVPTVVQFALANGYAGYVDDEALRHAYDMGRFNKFGASYEIRTEYEGRFPPQVRAAPTGYQWQTLTGPSSSPYAANPKPLYTAPDYQWESKMDYFKGNTSQYMCGSSSFCD